MTADADLIYLDYNATTPIRPEVAAAMQPFLMGHYGNPSSIHAFGVAAKRAVETARAQVAALIGARPEEIIFTSGGSESNNTVLKGVAARAGAGGHIITSAVEHPAILEPCRFLAEQGYRITVLEVDPTGRVDPEDVARTITAETILITIMHANNEVGTIQPIPEIAAVAREHGVLLHTDAAQSVGKIPVDVHALGVDFLSVAGHKLYGPKGVGALYVRSGQELPKLIHGASHESDRRAGTENVLEIVGLGRAAELAAADLEVQAERVAALRDRLWGRLYEVRPDTRRHGDPERVLPNTLSVSFPRVDAGALLAEIGNRVAASAGAACHADGVEVSTVLEAMGVPVDVAMGTVRFSLGRETSAADVDAAAEVVLDALARLGPVDTAEAVAPVLGEEVKLTRFTHGMGCACKLRPQALETVLRELPPITDPRVLVDLGTSDDAAVVRLTDDLAVVQSVDFFTPVADDPEDFGAVSAANALSDLYAMGAQPLFALSIVGFPVQRLPLEVLSRILAGATRVAREAGIDIVGGHSVEDTEPKFGLCVTGVVHPDELITNAGARPGDRLVLTKALGTGVLATAVKRGLADEDAGARAVATMSALNRVAAEAMMAVGVHACTDVTGFGLLGHLREMAVASKVDVRLDPASVPVLPGVAELIAADVVPGGTRDNLDHVSSHVDWEGGRSLAQKLLLADAQTSGGLLISVSADRVASLMERLATGGVADAAVIGEVTTTGTGRIRV